MSEQQSKTLIRVVQVNPLLWKKSDKDYRDSKAKDATWKSIGQVLQPPMTGEAAATRFKSLRDAFNKQNKQEQLYLLQNPGSQFVSSSIYYESLRFLEPEIKRRSGCSNFTGAALNGETAKKKVKLGGSQSQETNWIKSEINLPESVKIKLTSESKEVETGANDPIFLIEVPTTPENYERETNSPGMILDDSRNNSISGGSSTEKLDVEAVFKDNTDTTGQLWDETALMGEPEAFLKTNLLPELLPQIELPVKSSKSTAPKLKVPPLDEFARKRNSDQCQVVDALTMVAQNTSDMFKHIIDKKNCETPKTEAPNAIATDPKLVILKFALDLVPEEHQAAWITEVLQSAQNYKKK